MSQNTKERVGRSIDMTKLEKAYPGYTFEIQLWKRSRDTSREKTEIRSCSDCKIALATFEGSTYHVCLRCNGMMDTCIWNH